MPKPEFSPNVVTPEPAAYLPGATTIWQDSWRRMFDCFGGMIIAFARREGLNEHSAEDVLQEVMTTLIQCQHGQATGYDPRAGTFQAWLKGVIHNRIRSIRRKDRKEQPVSSLPDPDTQPGAGSGPSGGAEIAQPPPEFERMDEERWQRAILVAALERVRARVNPENFAIYTALLEEVPAEVLARKHGKEVNNIYAIKHRCEGFMVAEGQALRTAWEQLRQPNP